jgi:hypothetical protein
VVAVVEEVGRAEQETEHLKQNENNMTGLNDSKEKEQKHKASGARSGAGVLSRVGVQVQVTGPGLGIPRAKVQVGHGFILSSVKYGEDKAWGTMT